MDREKRVAEPGIVADMVRQFADKHAFLRELVQNGIDAGATRIAVMFDRDDRGTVRTSVTDDGAGMARAVIEGPFLTLFSSSKEGDKSKIGKYGIGFVSVFAIEPEVVEVRTTTDREAWLVRLFADHSWELQEDRSGAPRGTTVTLVQQMAVEAYRAHVAAGTAALEKWCRHARVPIEVTILDAGDPSSAQSFSLQQPFTAPGLVVVMWSRDEERVVASTGAVPGAPGTFIGYYNRGLTLFETDVLLASAVGLEGVRVKIDSPKLSHTLSRDGVVRDAQHDRLIGIVHDLVADKLWTQLLQDLTEAALDGQDASRYLALLEAASVSAFALQRTAAVIPVPLVEPLATRRTLPFATILQLARGKVLFSDAATPITLALAKQGVPVVRWLALRTALSRLVSDEAKSESELAEITHAIAYCAPDPDRHDGDDELEATLSTLFDRIGRTAEAVVLSRFLGAANGAPYRVTTERESAIRVERAMVPAWGRGAVVHLNTEDPGVRLARRRARTEPKLAAHLLLRALLVAEGPLSPKIVDRLLEAASGTDG